MARSYATWGLPASGTPRASMRLVRVDSDVRLLTVKTGIDLTDRMVKYARRLGRAAGVGGSVRLCAQKGLTKLRTGTRQDLRWARSAGQIRSRNFAAALLDGFPNLPLEEEGRLSDPRLRENFVERVFGYWRLRGLFAGRWSPGALVRFHTAHKLILMAHSPDAYRQLGRLVAGAGSVPRKEMERRYTLGFMAALAALATPRRHANVLQHMVGYFKVRLDRDSKTELLAAIDDYRRELVPLIVPMTLLRHHVRVHNVGYLAGQLYLEPHPKELMLRNHV